MPRHFVSVVLAMLAFSAFAQYPNRPLRLLHGFAAGGNADVVARIVAVPLQAGLGQPVVVESRPGAGGNIAAETAARSPPDGYTLVVLPGGHAVSGAMYRSLPFKPVDDFAFISTLTFFPFAVVARPDAEYRTLAEFIAHARRNPGTTNFSTAGVGTTQHLTGELINSQAKLDMVHIPFKGGGAPMQSVLAGETQLNVETLTVVLTQIKAGKLRALATSGAERAPDLPDVPTVGETLAGFDVRSWLGIAAPRATPPEIVERLNREIVKLLADPETRGKLRALGAEVRGGTPQEFRDLVAREIAKWAGVIEAAKLPRQ